MKTFFQNLSLCILLCFSACKNEQNETPKESENKTVTTDQNNAVETFKNKEAFFGETHMHTAYSLDAFIGGNRFTPDQSLRFAQGEAITLEKFGKSWQLKRPLDWAAVTDHAEYIGEAYSIMTPGAPGFDSEAATAIREVDNLEDGLKLFIKYVVSNNRSDKPSHPEFYTGVNSTMNAWAIMNEATEKHNQPGKFTT